MIYSPENILNLVILVLLVVMIAYCVVLNRRLKAFQSIKQELADMINQLNASTTHAQKSIAQFKNTVLEEEKKIGQKLKEAAEMAEELDMINQTGSNLADRIEKGLTGNRQNDEEEYLNVVEENKETSGRISLSDLDKNEDAATENGNEDGDLRESLRNVR